MIDHFVRQPVAGSGEIVSFRGNKVIFAQNHVSQLPAENFEIFRPMFDFINEKLN